MADTFKLEDNRIVARAPNIWTLDGSMRFNFVKPHIARFPCRMAIIRLDGGLLLWSPLPPTPDVLTQVQALGVVRWIVAPNSLHWLWAGAFAKAIRDAGGSVMLLAAPGLRTKPEVVATGVVWDAYLPQAAPSDWAGIVECVHIQGIPLVEEVVLIHTPSATLFGCELAFNFQKGHPCLDAGWPMNWYFDKMGGYRPCCATRTFRYLSDAHAVKASIEEVLCHEFDRYVPAHGAVIETGAQAALRAGSLDMFTEFTQPPPPQKRSAWPPLLLAAAAVVGLAIAIGRARGGKV